MAAGQSPWVRTLAAAWAVRRFVFVAQRHCSCSIRLLATYKGHAFAFLSFVVDRAVGENWTRELLIIRFTVLAIA